jgi:hypothetical protein
MALCSWIGMLDFNNHISNNNQNINNKQNQIINFISLKIEMFYFEFYNFY